METQKFYIGPRGVDFIVADETKTFGGNEVVVVNYDGGYKEVMSKKTYELISTTEPGDLTITRNKKLGAISAELYPLIAEFISSLGKPIEEVLHEFYSLHDLFRISYILTNTNQLYNKRRIYCKINN